MSDASTKFAELLRAHKRIGVAGGPRCGKTTLCAAVTDRPVIHTDDFKHLDWADVPDAVIAACNGLDAFVVEGVQVARSLRAGLEVDVVVTMNQPFERLKTGQISMQKGVRTVLADWRETTYPPPHVIKLS